MEYSVPDIEKCTLKIVAVVAKGEAGKDFKTDTNTRMRQYPNLDLSWIGEVTQLAAATRAPEGGRPQQADEEGDEIYYNSTSTEEADEATKLSKLRRLTLIKKKSSLVSATTETLLKGSSIKRVGETLTWHGP